MKWNMKIIRTDGKPIKDRNMRFLDDVLYRTYGQVRSYSLEDGILYFRTLSGESYKPDTIDDLLKGEYKLEEI